ncbi:MAG: hypothetical protein EKK29_18685 [Hyphomicrobiales bacterium]|nr:MAG: hypothetical protein EKK29_18685 [Hyphomicrobiales bacterium]
MVPTTKLFQSLLDLPGAAEWFGVLRPAWLSLDPRSLEALREEPLNRHGALRIAADATQADADMSPVLRNAIILLEAASKGDGLKLTATGNLARVVVDDMRYRFEWPGYEKASTLGLYKVINEPDFMPLHFIRITAAHAGLLRRRKGVLTTTPAARELLSRQRFGPLQAILFHTALWRLDLSYFGRGLLGSWPQGDVGIVLWSLSIAAWDLQTSSGFRGFAPFRRRKLSSGGFGTAALWPSRPASCSHCSGSVYLNAARRSPRRMNGAKRISIGNRRCSTGS